MVSTENGLNAAKVIAGEKEALTLQVSSDAETLRGVFKAAVLLRFNPGVNLPGVTRGSNGLFIIRPLMAILTDLLKRVELEEQTVAAAA
jgi:hypothetical protein